MNAARFAPIAAAVGMLFAAVPAHAQGTWVVRVGKSVGDMSAPRFAPIAGVMGTALAAVPTRAQGTWALRVGKYVYEVYNDSRILQNLTRGTGIAGAAYGAGRATTARPEPIWLNENYITRPYQGTSVRDPRYVPVPGFQ